MDLADTLDAATWLLQEGRPADARLLLLPVVGTRPRHAPARLLLALALERTGDIAGAEAQVRAGLRHDRGNAALAVALADLLAASGREAEAEPALRAALRESRKSVDLAMRLSDLLIAVGRPTEALAVTAPLAAAAAPDHALLAAHASTLKLLGQADLALDVHRRAAGLFPDSVVAHHNLAASLGDAGQFAASEASAARAFASGGNAPQTWLVHARALLGQHRLDAAELALRETIRLAPDYADAHRDLAQLVWMRTEDAAAATAALDAALRTHPGTVALHRLRATTLSCAGDTAGATATLRQAITLHPRVTELHVAAAEAAVTAGDMQRATAHARQAIALAPGNVQAEQALFRACAAAGEIAEAAMIAEALVRRDPGDQAARAYQATAWRLLGDARYGALHDYDRLVRAWTLDVPEGWDTLAAFLAELAPALERVHPFRTHPLEQSVRHGSQSSHLDASGDPVVQALFRALDGPIRRHLAWLGPGEDPVRTRNRGSYAIQGAWSVRLRPGGFHMDHVHPQGWLSSACHIAVPAARDVDDRAGWIKFGEPGIATAPPLGAEHYIRPEPGTVVLFPSYMWHGTVPFPGDQARLTVAFDLVPGAEVALK